MGSSQTGNLRTSPTIDDVARRCGLSKSTVSKALNAHAQLVSESTRKRVLEVAESLGFTPNWRARALATRRSQMIAVLNSARHGAVPRGVYWEICDHLDDRLSEHDYSLTFIHAREAYPRLEQMLGDGRFDAVLTLGVIDPSVLAMVRRRRLPAVLINSAADETWTRIAVDDKGGTKQAMQHLMSLGHRRIVYRAGMRLDHPSWVDRYTTYRQCMADAGLEPLQEQIGGAPEFVRWLLEQSPADRPTAVIDFEHWTAVHLAQALWRAGLCVPEDLSIVTFNDTYPVADVIPPLTALALPSQQIAELATRMILERIEAGECAPRTVVLPEQLVVRESTARPGGSSPGAFNSCSSPSRVGRIIAGQQIAASGAGH